VLVYDHEISSTLRLGAGESIKKLGFSSKSVRSRCAQVLSQPHSLERPGKVFLSRIAYLMVYVFMQQVASGHNRP
jgi:hypothetical protein